MRYIIKVLSNENKEDLIRFESTIHGNEPDIWTEKFDEEKYRELVVKNDISREKNFIVAAFDGDRMVGRCDVVVYENLYDFTKTAYIDWLYVDINYRNKGIATNLINESSNILEKANVGYAYLFAASNKEAQKFYQNLDGYQLKEKVVAQKYFK